MFVRTANRPAELACMALDRPVPRWYDERLAMPRFNGTYLKPLLAMIRANDMEIRRQAICALANLSDQPFRGAHTSRARLSRANLRGGHLTACFACSRAASVAALKNSQGRSLLWDMLEFTRPPFELPQRKEAVTALTNLMRNQTVHRILFHERMLPEIIRLSRTCVRSSTMVGRKPPLLPSRSRSSSSMAHAAPSEPRIPTDAKLWDSTSMRLIVFALACLCGNRAIIPQLLGTGFVAELVRVSLGDDPEDAIVQRNGVYGIALLSYTVDAQVEIRQAGGLVLAGKLLGHRDADIRRHGAKLACNLCLHPGNKHEAIRSPLLDQLLSAATEVASMGGAASRDADDLALAIASLTVDLSLIAQLDIPRLVSSLLVLLQSGSDTARQHAAWALSNVATLRPTALELLDPTSLQELMQCASYEGAPSRSGRRDALRCLSWMVSEHKLGPGHDGGGLLDIVVQCALSSDMELQDAALLMLATWTECVAYHAELIHGGVLEPLVWSLSHASPIAQLCGARALACLSIHDYYIPKMVQAGAAEPLVRLMRSRVPHVRQSACRAACALSKDVAGSLELLHFSGMSAGLTVAQAAPSPDDQRGPGAPTAAEYAEQAVRNMEEAWAIEELSVAHEERSLRALLERALLPGQDEEVVLSHSCVQARVETPSNALIVPTFNAWKILLCCKRRYSEEVLETRAASRIQHGMRVKSRRRERKAQARAAAQIQATRRGQLSRRKQGQLPSRSVRSPTR